jgi:hypothetical protein
LTAPYQKWREPCVVFLDDCFDAEGASEMLLANGFCRVERFTDHFRRPTNGAREQNVKDPRVIQLCNTKKWLLVTMDANMVKAHVKEIGASGNIAILATAHNSCPDPFEWIDALIRAKTWIEREFRKRRRPWFAQYNRQGKKTTIFTIDADWTTRRVRSGGIEDYATGQHPEHA